MVAQVASDLRMRSPAAQAVQNKTAPEMASPNVKHSSTQQQNEKSSPTSFFKPGVAGTGVRINAQPVQHGFFLRAQKSDTIGVAAQQDFTWSETDEPHATRRRIILAKYPEIAKLVGSVLVVAVARHAGMSSINHTFGNSSMLTPIQSRLLFIHSLSFALSRSLQSRAIDCANRLRTDCHPNLLGTLFQHRIMARTVVLCIHSRRHNQSLVAIGCPRDQSQFGICNTDV